MTKFDYEMEKIQQRRYEERILRLNQELAFSVQNRTRSEALSALRASLILPSRVFDAFAEKQPANA